jgi:hypothetical protein
LFGERFFLTLCSCFLAVNLHDSFIEHLLKASTVLRAEDTVMSKALPCWPVTR